jgi:hypothetical protein
MSGGVVGGLSSVAMGGDFWQGFTSAAVAAGVSLAANAVAGEIENAQSGGTGEGDSESGTGQATVTVTAKAPKTPMEPIQEPVSDLIPDAKDVPDAYRNVTIVHGTDLREGDHFVSNSVANLKQAALAKGYSEEQIHIVEVKDLAALTSALNDAPPSAALITVFHSAGSRVFLTNGVSTSYKQFEAAISKTAQGQPWGRTILWGCHMENAGYYLATQYGWPNWTAVGHAYGNLYGEGGIVQWR